MRRKTYEEYNCAVYLIDNIVHFIIMIIVSYYCKKGETLGRKEHKTESGLVGWANILYARKTVSACFGLT